MCVLVKFALTLAASAVHENVPTANLKDAASDPHLYELHDGMEKIPSGKWGGAEASRSSSEGCVGLPNAALVVMAHSRVDTLETVLNALLAQPEIDRKCFKLYALPDCEPVAARRSSPFVAAVNSVTFADLPTHTPHTPPPLSPSGPRYVSVDQPHEGIHSLAGRLGVSVIQHDLAIRPDGQEFTTSGLNKISVHFRMAIDRLLGGAGEEGSHSHLVVMEDDLQPAADFLSLFREAAPSLNADPALFCVSSWNDNGLGLYTHDDVPARSVRLQLTDYFPGLGWMLRKELWAELKKEWPRQPTTGWDHWLRLGAASTRARSCIVPALSRVTHIGGEGGTNVHDPGNKMYKR